MPTYEYCCCQCGHTFSVKRPFSESDASVACPNCSSSHTKKKLNKPFTKSNSAASSGGCGGCSGGNCTSCGH